MTDISSSQAARKESLAKTGWGVENMPFPNGVAYIQTRWDLCIGCGLCEIACSLHHFGVINRELARIRIYRYLTPLPKSVQSVCVQCAEQERECQKACPVDPPAIYYDEKTYHMKVDKERCLGYSCGMCHSACPAQVPRFYPASVEYPLVCDLCEREGQRRPQCVEACPNCALEFLVPSFPQHLERVHPDEKAQCLSRRLYPLTEDGIQRPPEEIWKE